LRYIAPATIVDTLEASGREEPMRRILAAWAVVSFCMSAMLFAPVSAQPTCTNTGDNRANDMHATSAPDVLCGRGGDDRIAGRGGDDTLLGQRGSDLLIGGSGGDTLVGGGQNDTLIDGPGDDLLKGGIGGDILDGTGSGHDVLKGGGGRDVCYADPGDRTRGCERRV
jgi:Ca2+-binding RTX toxin-like protein